MDHQIEGTHLVHKKVTKHRFRKTIIAAWKGRCAYCDEILGRNATLDHIIPRSKGGETIATNLVACCLSCNSHKSSHPVFDWYKERAWYCLEREVKLRKWIEGGAFSHFPHDGDSDTEDSTSPPLATAEDDLREIPPPPHAKQFPDRY